MTTSDRKTWKTVARGEYVDSAALPSQPDRVLATTPTGAVHEVRLDSTQRPLAGTPELVLIDSTPQGRIVGITSGGELYGTSRLMDQWRHDGQVPGTPTALAATDGTWPLAPGRGHSAVHRRRSDLDRRRGFTRV